MLGLERCRAAGAMRLMAKIFGHYSMNSKTLVAVILVTFGLVVLAYSGLAFTTPGKPVDFLGLHVATTVNHFIPPVAGALAFVGGLMLWIVKPREI